MDNVDKSSESKTTNVTLGLILSSAVGALLVIAGIGFIMSNLIAGILVLVAGFIMFPSVGTFIRQKTNVNFSGGVRFIFALILFAIAASIIGSAAVSKVTGGENADAGTASDVSSAAAQPDKDLLELVSYNCSREYGYFKITGQVKNISDRSLESVEAVGSIYTKDGEFIKSDNAIVEYNPILSGQTSPFEVISTDNPAASKCTIDFKEFFGGTIPTKRATE